jgi:hypothetical protein
MDTNAIETLAANAVSDSITIADILLPFIEKNDKEPSWDGQIYLYNSSRKAKDNMMGYVRVQSKGHECNYLSKKKITFPVNTDDMRNYLNTGGAVYFVTYVKSNGIDKHIYYNTLTPIKLRRYLDEAKDQGTKSIEFKSFPSENNRKCTILLNFFNDSKRQTSFVNKGMLTIEDLQNSKDITGIKLSMSGYGQSQGQAFRAFFDDEVYLYATVKGTDALIPVEMMLSKLKTTETLNWIVNVNGKIYYNSVSKEMSKDNRIVTIGKSLFIVADRNDKLKEVKYVQTPMLRDRIKDMAFLIDIFKTGSFNINGINIDFNPTDEEKKHFDIDKMKHFVEQGNKAIQMLDELNIEKDFNLDTLSKQEHMEIVNLIVAFVDKKPVPHLKKDLPVICRITIQNIKLLLIYQQIDTDSGIYQILDFFKSNLSVIYSSPDSEEKLVTSNYSILQKEDYNSIDNINYDMILPSYETNLKHNPRIFEQANNDLLKMLLAYDEGNDVNNRLLQLSKDLAQWIFDKDVEDVVPYDVKLLNVLQIIRREREFYKDEIMQVINITESDTDREDVKTAAYLLLDNHDAAEMHFEKLDKDWRDGFKTYPIYRFWKNTEEEQNEQT